LDVFSDLLLWLQAFQLIDKAPFWQLLSYLCLSLTEKDIPHRHTLRAEIIDRARLAEERVKLHLKVCDCHTGATFD
jgi:hypothetical protein